MHSVSNSLSQCRANCSSNASACDLPIDRSFKKPRTEQTRSSDNRRLAVGHMGDGDDDLRTEFAPTDDAGNRAVASQGSAIHPIGDQHRTAVFPSPDQPDMREGTPLVGHAIGIDRFESPDEFHLFVVGTSAALGRSEVLQRVLELLLRVGKIGKQSLQVGRTRWEIALGWVESVHANRRVILQAAQG